MTYDARRNIDSDELIKRAEALDYDQVYLIALTGEEIMLMTLGCIEVFHAQIPDKVLHQIGSANDND